MRQLDEHSKKLQQGAEYVQKLQGYLAETTGELDQLKAQQQVPSSHLCVYLSVVAAAAAATVTTVTTTAHHDDLEE